MSTDFNGASFTASELLTDVLRAARLPDTGTIDYTPTVVLRMCSDAIWNWAIPQLSTARDGRLLTAITRVPLSFGTNLSFELPPMAVADTIDGVTWANGAGIARRLQVIPANMLPLFTQSSDRGEPEGYTLADGTIRVFPVCMSGSLAIHYQRRHSALVVGSDTSVILSFTEYLDGLAQITVSAAPPGWVVGTWVDVIGKYYPYRTKVHGARIVLATAPNEFVISVPFSELLEAQCAGDTVATYGLTPYVQLPLEMKQPLVQHVAANIMAELGDVGMVGLYDQRSTAGAQRTAAQLSPRTKGDRPKIRNPNSLARGAVSGRRRWREDSF